MRKGISSRGATHGGAGAGTGLSTARVEALADGIFSIAMTLLILELKVPSLGHAAGDRQILAALPPVALKFGLYVLSFLALGNFWVAHRAQFHFIRRTDRTLLWLGLVFFLLVSAVPFSTAFLGEYPGRRVPAVLYGVNLALSALALYAHWTHAARRHLLGHGLLDAAAVAAQARRILVGPVIYLAGILLCAVNAYLSLALYLLVPLYYLLPGRHWHTPHEEHAAETDQE